MKKKHLFDEYIEKNNAYWKLNIRDKSNKKNVGIYFESLSENFIPLMMAKIVSAEGIRCAINCDIYEFKFRSNKRHKRIAHAFYFRCCGIFNRNFIQVLFMSVLETLKYLKSKSWLQEDVSYKCGKVEIGDLIYDHIIRVTNYVTLNNEKLTLKDAVIVLRAMMTFYLADFQYRRVKPLCFVASDLIYINAIPARLATMYGAEIITVTTGKQTKVYPKECIFDGFKMFPVDLEYYSINNNEENINDDYENFVNKYLFDIYNGIGDWNISNAYENKIVSTKNTILNALGINNNKKNIFVMPHCFSDAPHCSSGAIYKDYYEWLEKTLELISNIKNVNWIIKEHPCHKEYNEQGVVWNLFNKYKTDNIFYLPNDYSTAVVPQVADAILTVRGSAGMEMTCQGIPCVLGGFAYYSDISSLKEPRNEDEYKEILNNLDGITRLSSDQIKESKRKLYLGLKYYEDVDDKLQMVTSKHYLRFFYCKDRSKFDLDEFFKEYIEILDSNCKDSLYWFKWSYDWAKKTVVL